MAFIPEPRANGRLTARLECQRQGTGEARRLHTLRHFIVVPSTGAAQAGAGLCRPRLDPDVAGRYGHLFPSADDAELAGGRAGFRPIN